MVLFHDNKILGLVPARAGSKGIQGKNIKPLAGKPLITHTIACALESGVLDALIVSTDGVEIAGVARKAGAEVPFLRPGELATDSASAMDVLHHAMAWCEENNRLYNWVMILQPTSPLRTAMDIKAACSLMRERKGTAVVSVSAMEHHPWWSNTLPADGCMKNFLRPEVTGVGRQQLPPYYRINGAIYLAEWDFIRHSDSWYGLRTFAYLMPVQRSVDIDSEVDFKLAEILLKG